MPGPSKESLLPNPFARAQSHWSAQSRTRRELLALAAALAFGLLVLPWLIWIVGALSLGPYARGGVLSFIADFFVALARGDVAFWIIVLGPMVFLAFVRLLWLGLRRDEG